jgi:hypothetical protein
VNVAGGPVTGTVTWSPNGKSQVSTPLRGKGARLTGVVGPFTATGPRTLTVTVHSTTGQGSATATAALLVRACLRLPPA